MGSRNSLVSAHEKDANTDNAENKGKKSSSRIKNHAQTKCWSITQCSNGLKAVLVSKLTSSLSTLTM